jgi:ADP-ribosylglycohydrolase
MLTIANEMIYLDRMEELTNRILASFYGMAFGDALGGQVASITVEEIADRFGPCFHGMDFEDETPFLVGADTQMAMYSCLAMRAGTLKGNYTEEVIRHLCYWFDDPRSNRNPSQHTLKAITLLRKGLHWSGATNVSMNSGDPLVRSVPIAYWLTGEACLKQRWGLAMQFAALTHAHPAVMISSALLCEAVSYLLTNRSSKHLLEHLDLTLQDMSGHWPEELCSSLWELPGFNSPLEYLDLGVKKCKKIWTLVNY